MNKKSERLKKIISEIDSLITQGVTSNDVAFSTWENKAKSFILSIILLIISYCGGSTTNIAIKNSG